MRKLIVAIFIFMFTGCYYLQQGIRLADIYSKAVPVGAALSEDGMPEDEKKLILTVGEVREYAASELGLVLNNNYTTYIRTDKYLADVVSACKDDSFEQYQFDFLFIGKLPYMGFFKPEEAQKKASELAAKNYDVMVRKVEAFSTIGILSDPIMSYMKRSSEYRIAEVIIHEQVHATVFMTDYPDASENFATFIGSEGALGFMKSRYGESSDEYRLCLAIDEDSETFNRLLRELYSTLDGIYKSEKTRDEKLALKAEEIAKWKAGIESDYKNVFKTTAYTSVKDLQIDNAYIATNLNYTRNLDLYKKLFEKTGSIRGMIGVMKDITKDKSRNPEAILLEYLEGKTGDIGSRNDPDK